MKLNRLSLADMSMLQINNSVIDFGAPIGASDSHASVSRTMLTAEAERGLYQPFTGSSGGRTRAAMPLVFGTLLTGASISIAPPAEAASQNINVFPIYSARDDDQRRHVSLTSADSSVERGLPTWIVSMGYVPPPVILLDVEISQIFSDLESLENGWDGASSQAPSEYVKNDMRALASFIGTVRPPEVEVDEDGSIALRWESGAKNFAITLHGNGKMIGTLYPRSDNFPQEIRVDSTDDIATFFALEEVRSSLA